MALSNPIRLINQNSQLRRLLRDQFLSLGDKVREWHRGLLLLAAGAHVDGAGGFFLVAKDEDVRRLLQREVANLRVHFFVASVDLDAQAGGF